MKGFTGKMAWTVGGFFASSGLRFILNIILSRLLAPDIMGVMVVVNAVRLGIELLTDVGIEQNIIHHPDGLTRPFRDTAWTMQVMRGVFLSALFALAAPFLAEAYHIDVRIFLLAACSPFLGGLHSTAVFVLVKQMEVRRRNQFEIGSEALAFAVSVALAWSLRSVWAPAMALVASVAIRSALSYLLPEARQSFRHDPEIRRRIVHFGKWIMVTSLVMYAATNLDRLYLGRAVPIALVGIYGIARAIADLPTTLARRLSYQIIFPAIVAARNGEAEGVEHHMARSRLVFVLGVCGALAVGAGIGDWLISLLYDHRYASAGWILGVLLIGGVFAVLSNLNEALLLGVGRPALSSYANAARFVTMALLLPLGLHYGGFPGAVMAIAFVEICQYAYISAGLLRMRLGYWRQDAMALATALIMLGGVCALRSALGLGTSFAPIRGLLP
ncbi:oligosaccharide flippase family protein [Novosphingobium rosa]|uniref:oligosaccharide flippase family protein n=1 Tax=Novosphingobium rosa TaxID=76978 RepID=UPI0008321529|nr:oligosaccharide flippase family protein [Novosphingobium rosa]